MTPASSGDPAASLAAASMCSRTPMQVWLGLSCLVFAALVSLAYVLLQQFGPLRNEPFQADEEFFSACAARAGLEGGFSLVSCHDNKGPLIILVHRLVQLGGEPYDWLHVKLTAMFVVFLVAYLLYRLGRRFGGHLPGMTGVAAAALFFTAVLPNPTFLALKTEMLGAVFMLAAQLALLPGSGPLGGRRVLLAGACIGTALLSKQVYGFLLPAALVWLAMLAREGHSMQWSRLLRQSVLLGLGTSLPPMSMALLFASQGAGPEFFATLLLFPSVYAKADTLTLMQKLLWHGSTMVTLLAARPIHLLLAVAAAWQLVQGCAAAVVARTWRADPLWLPALFLLSMLGVLWISPVLYDYHLIPSYILLAELGAIALARAWQRERPGFDGAALVVPTLLTLSLLAMVATLRGNSVRTPVHAAKVQTSPQDRYGYVFGLAPQFYTQNRLLPASGVMFPWALPGAPAFSLFTPPPDGSWRSRWLKALHGPNRHKLLQDFERTPPAWIAVVHGAARAGNSSHTVDMPGFDEYLQRHCRFQRHFLLNSGAPEIERQGSLYHCAD